MLEKNLALVFTSSLCVDAWSERQNSDLVSAFGTKIMSHRICTKQSDIQNNIIPFHSYF